MKKFTLLLLLLVAGSNVRLAYSQGCLTAWQYRMPVTITNSNAGALNDHQVLVTINTQSLIGSGFMNADCSDMRFSSNCCDQLCFWIESGVNTANTNVWVKVPAVAASNDTVIYMYYGNTSAVLSSNADCTFDLYDNFDGDSSRYFSDSGCGPLSSTFTSGNMGLSWSNSGIFISDSVFPVGNVYTVEADVNSASGDWPGIYWLKDDVDHRGYGNLFGGSQVRISKSGSNTGYCQGHNWASSLFSPSSTTGLWSLTWIGTGNITAEFPTVGTMTSTDVQHAKDQDLRLGIGGIASGTGSININWVRVRKYAAVTPTYSFGSQEANVALPVVSLQNDTIVCPSEMVTLDAGGVYTSYSWSTGATSQSIMTDVPGVYTVTVTDNVGCMSTDSVALSNYPLVSVDLGADTTVCYGTSLLLNAGSVYFTYSWSTGASGQTIMTQGAGAYSVEVTDVNGCTGGDTIVVSEYSQLIADFTAGVTGLDVVFTSTSTGASTYAWDFGDGNTSASANPNHTYGDTGPYTVCLTVTNADGCTEDTCMVVTIAVAGLETEGTHLFSVYPNPAADVVYIHADFNGTATIQLFDMAGKKVYNGISTTDTHQLNVSGFVPGVYLLRIEGETFSETQRLIVR